MVKKPRWQSLTDIQFTSTEWQHLCWTPTGKTIHRVLSRADEVCPICGLSLKEARKLSKKMWRHREKFEYLDREACQLQKDKLRTRNKS